LHFQPESITIYSMKRLFLQYVCIVLLLFGGAGILSAYELEFTAGVNGMTFHPDKTRAYTDTGDIFEAYPFGLGALNFRHDVSETFSFSINLERDNILKNSLNAMLKSRTDNFRFEFGPFFGLPDGLEFPDTGIIGELELAFPGIFFISISGSSSLGSHIDFFSENSRETAGVKAGFWIKGTVLSFSASYKNLARQEEEFLIVTDSLTRYCGSLDFYAKRSRVTGSFFGGYQTYSRNYKRGNLDFSDVLSAWYAGMELKIQVSKPLELKFGLEIPIKNIPVEPLIITDDFIFLSKAYAGFVYSIK